MKILVTWKYQIQNTNKEEEIMRRDIMVDIETLGTGEGATIFQIAAMSFDIRTGYIYDSINLIGNIEKYESLKVDGSTLKWWLNTNKELLADLLNRGNITEYEMAQCFYNWLYKQAGTDEHVDNVYLWGNGILFDNAKLQKFMNETGKLHYPIGYKNDRDVRTILELASMRTGKTEKWIKDSVAMASEVEHDALDDTRYQIRLVSTCYQLLMGTI